MNEQELVYNVIQIVRLTVDNSAFYLSSYPDISSFSFYVNVRPHRVQIERSTMA